MYPAVMPGIAGTFSSFLNTVFEEVYIPAAPAIMAGVPRTAAVVVSASVSANPNPANLLSIIPAAIIVIAVRRLAGFQISKIGIGRK